MTVKARARFFLAEEEELKAGRWALGRPRARVHVAYAKGRRPLPGGPGLAVRTGPRSTDRAVARADVKRPLSDWQGRSGAHAGRVYYSLRIVRVAV